MKLNCTVSGEIRFSREAAPCGIYLEKLVGPRLGGLPIFACARAPPILEGLAKDRKVDSTCGGFRSTLVPFYISLYPVVRLPRKLEMLNDFVVQFHQLFVRKFGGSVKNLQMNNYINNC